MSPKSAGRSNGRHDLDVFQLYKLQVIIIESLMHHCLLKEHDDLWGIIFVRSWQVDILQIQHQSSAFTGSIDATSGARGDATELAKLLQNVLVEALGSC